MKKILIVLLLALSLLLPLNYVYADTSNVDYEFTYIDHASWSLIDGSYSTEGNAYNYAITPKTYIRDNNINITTVSASYILFWNTTGGYLGYGSFFEPYDTYDKYLGNFTVSGITIPSGATSFALMAERYGVNGTFNNWATTLQTMYTTPLYDYYIEDQLGYTTAEVFDTPTLDWYDSYFGYNTSDLDSYILDDYFNYDITNYGIYTLQDGYAVAQSWADIFGTNTKYGGSNSLIENGNFSVDTNSDGLADNWITTGSTNYYILNGYQALSITSNAQYVYQLEILALNHYYYMGGDVWANSLTNSVYIRIAFWTTGATTINSIIPVHTSHISTITNTSSSFSFRPLNNNAIDIFADNLSSYDFTSIFGVAEENPTDFPTLATFDKWSNSISVYQNQETFTGANIGYEYALQYFNDYYYDLILDYDKMNIDLFGEELDELDLPLLEDLWLSSVAREINDTHVYYWYTDYGINETNFDFWWQYNIDTNAMTPRYEFYLPYGIDSSEEMVEFFELYSYMDEVTPISFTNFSTLNDFYYEHELVDSTVDTGSLFDVFTPFAVILVIAVLAIIDYFLLKRKAKFIIVLVVDIAVVLVAVMFGFLPIWIPIVIGAIILIVLFAKYGLNGGD